ncbi:MAG TPA: SIMPL domain-containing protein [Jatrophihabitans sp.]|nr:SIMPL domain-containing protein [Jatrophihabitans sp.]
MPTDDAHTLLSVRGQAQRTVAPDQANIWCFVENFAGTPGEAAGAVNGTLTALTGELAGLGGQPLTPDTTRSPLTWSAQSLNVQPEYDYDKVTRTNGPTGRQHASVSVLLTVRDFELLAGVSSVITGHTGLSVHSVGWSVDADNPGWPQVRADAIQAALRTGQDYAAALGGAVVAVQHVADAGLLGGDQTARATFATANSAPGQAGGSTVTLDPVPQQLNATIEARFSATIGPLPPR